MNTTGTSIKWFRNIYQGYLVEAVQYAESGTVIAEPKDLSVKVGDWVVTDYGGGQYVVDGKLFHDMYEPVVK